MCEIIVYTKTKVAESHRYDKKLQFINFFGIFLPEFADTLKNDKNSDI